MELRLNIGICDDEPVQVEIIHEFLKKRYAYFNMNIFAASSGVDLIKYASQTTLDIVFLDMEMSPLNGIETGKKLLEQNKDIIIIYITGFKDYCLHAFQVKPLDYIIKPITENRFNTLMEDVILRYKQIKALHEKSHKFVLNTKDTFIQLNYEDIIFFEKSLRKITLYSTKGQYSFYFSMKKLKDMLDMEHFIQCHQSYIVHDKYILVLKDNELFIRDINMSIPVSRTHKAEVLEVLEKNLFL